ncbi:MAG: hypothetical protein SGJ27_29895 [Candidatus Melainabacteria bacterium]|nr:hypothetical protein [Candidatus Melainabacteria bacterium]
MDLGVWYGVLALISVIFGVIARFAAYTVLVKFKRWLPEKATGVANIIAAVIIVVGLIAVGAHMMLGGK